MIGMKEFHCDGPECEIWAKSQRTPVDWIVVRQGRKIQHFCQWDCVMRHAAQFPTETIPADDPAEE